METDKSASQSSPETDTELHPVDQPVEVASLPQVETITADEQRKASAMDTTSRLELLLEEMHALREDFDTKVKYDESKERLIDSLHKELQIYREGLHFKLLRPLFMDLIAMHDDLGKLIDAALFGQINNSIEQSIKNLRSFQETIEEILQRHGVDSFSAEGLQFFPGKQRALKAVDTPDPALDKQVARRVRKGFQYDERVLRPELVDIYRTV